MKKYFLSDCEVYMEFYFNKELYSRDALVRAAYNFTDKAYLHLDADDNNYIVYIEMKSKDMELSEKEFQNEILAQMVRINVQKRTKNVRELMLARALASTVIEQVEVKEDNASEENIHDILQDWFKKYE